MAMMINCATDWTYDMFIEDSKKYNATPIKAVHCSRNASAEECFMTWFKNCARDFRIKWESKGRRDYDDRYGYIGDAFAKDIIAYDCFSDYYKIDHIKLQEVYTNNLHPILVSSSLDMNI